MTQSLPVLFRADKSGPYAGDVTALFPTLQGSNAPNTLPAYATIGQHHTASIQWMHSNTRAANADEYGDLLSELQAIYSDCELVVCDRMARHHTRERRGS